MIKNLEVKELINLSEFELYRPYLFALNEEYDVFIYDYGLNNFYIIKCDKFEIKTLGDGLGGGPKEFRNPTHLYYSKELKQLWLTDPELNRISIWDKYGTYIKSIAVNEARLIPQLALPISDSTYFWQPRNLINEGYEFGISTNEGKLIRLLNKKEIDPLKARFLRIGNIITDNNDIYYTGYYKSIIKKFDINGNEIFTTFGIEPIYDIEVIQSEKKMSGYSNLKITKISPDQKHSILDFSIKNEHLFILFSGNSKGKFKYLDIYNSFDGSYIVSYAINKDIRKINIINKKIFVLYIDNKNYKIGEIVINAI